MTAQLGNGGFKIHPRIILDKSYEDYMTIKNKMSQNIAERNMGLCLESIILTPSLG
jgi:hypothetical protein